MKFKKFVLKSYPSNDFPQDLSCFQLKHDAELNESDLKEGEALIRIYWISVDPLLRTWISGAKSYVDAIGPGSSIPGFGVGKVEKILKKKGKKTPLWDGDWVFGMIEWSQYMIVDYKRIQKLPLDLQQETYKFLSIYGPSGFTSFCSIKREIMPFKMWSQKLNRYKNPEEMNIVISSVAGGIGLTVTEYLNKLGYRNVYGIAGTDEKCRVAKQLGCKDAINYKKYYKNGEIQAKEFESDVQKMMGGEEIDIYYENVGEDMLSSMLNLMAVHSKIVMCGATATYNSWGSKVGVNNFSQVISRRIEVKGILYFDVGAQERIQIFLEMGSLQMKGADVLIKGMEKLPESYRQMIAGKFIGKPIVQFVDKI